MFWKKYEKHRFFLQSSAAKIIFEIMRWFFLKKIYKKSKNSVFDHFSEAGSSKLSFITAFLGHTSKNDVFLTKNRPFFWPSPAIYTNEKFIFWHNEPNLSDFIEISFQKLTFLSLFDTFYPFLGKIALQIQFYTIFIGQAYKNDVFFTPF